MQPVILDIWRRHVVDGSGESAGQSASATVAADLIDVCGVKVSRREAALGLPVEQFAAVAKTLCGFPSFFAAPLFRRIRVLFDAKYAKRQPAVPRGPNEPFDAASGVDTDGVVPLEMFLHYWVRDMEGKDHYDRCVCIRCVVSNAPASHPPSPPPRSFFSLISQPGSHRIVPYDFMPFLEELLAFHPGLAFLESTPEFQEKYARTVIARMMYVCDPQARGFIDCRSLRRSNLMQAFHTVDMEEDINLVSPRYIQADCPLNSTPLALRPQVNDYFSYEHFYVLYCKFWELDTDRDFFLTRQDLSKLDNLTHTVLDRVFSQAGRRFTSGQPDKMAYEDFVCEWPYKIRVPSCLGDFPSSLRRLPDVRGGQDEFRVAAVLVPHRRPQRRRRHHARRDEAFLHGAGVCRGPLFLDGLNLDAALFVCADATHGGPEHGSRALQ